jgi:putative ABC transport system permease protein
MVKLSLRGLVTHKLRLLLTVAAVTLGVAFVSGTFVLSDTMSKAFDELYEGLTEGTDVAVRAELAYTDISTQGVTRPLDDDLVDVVSAVPGVAVAEGSLTGYALIVDEDGEPVQPGGAPTLGASISADDRLAGDFGFRSGRAPVAADEVALDAASARKAGYQVGETATVVLRDGPQQFTVVGVVGFGESDSLAGATMAAFDTETAQQLFGKHGQVDQINAVAEDGVSSESLRDAVAAALPPGVEALTGEQLAEEGSQAVREGLGVFTNVLLAFAAVSLFVGSFVIWNTFNVLVAGRRREVALLRSVGATRGQVLSGIVLEALVVGLVSALLGLFAGIGLAAGIRELFAAIGIEVPTTSPAVEPRTVVVSLLVGVVVTVVAAVVPAWSATRVAPVEALREATPTTSDVGPVRRTAGAALLLLGVLGLAVSCWAGNQPLLTGASTLVSFAGLVAAGPVLARGLARAADRGRRGSPWRLAARNIARAPQRAAATALALTIGLTVVCGVAVTAASAKESVAEAVSGGFRADLILKGAGQSLGLSPAVARDLRAREDVETVVSLRMTNARVEGHGTLVAAATTDGLDEVADLGIEGGATGDLVPGTVLVGEQGARSLGVGPGDRVSITFPETGRRSFEVVGTYEAEALVSSSYLLSMADFEENVTSRLDTAVLLSHPAGVDSASAKADIEHALADYANVVAQTSAELTADAQARLDQMLGLVSALLLLAVVVAVLGIVNTLVLAVVERTRELGLMRAVGATRRQVRTLVRRESVLMAVLGGLTGVGLGTLAGVALSRSLADSGITSLSVPVGTLVAYLLAATLVGVLAAVGPARRASRIDVLRAITVE